MACGGDLPKDVNPPVGGRVHVFNEDEVNPPVAGLATVIEEDDDNVSDEPLQDPNCVRCVQYRVQEETEKALSREHFNLTMFRLKCWSKDLYDILNDVQDDKIPDGENGMKDYIYGINQGLTAYFETYR